MARKVNLKLIEYQSTMIVRDSITIDLDDYEILRGLTDEEAFQYIKNNASDMEPTSDAQTWADSLYDEILDTDITREKDLGSTILRILCR